jgi:hypothetical protein
MWKCIDENYFAILLTRASAKMFLREMGKGVYLVSSRQNFAQGIERWSRPEYEISRTTKTIVYVGISMSCQR